MASVQFGGGITKMVGSHGGATFTTNKGGAYVKSKPMGTKSLTIGQSLRAVSLAMLSKYYTFSLTPGQQAAWRTFAAITPVVNRLGNTTFLSGHQMFIKLNSPLSIAGAGVENSPPGSTAISMPTVITIAAVHGGPGTLHVTVATGAPAANEVGYISVSGPQNPGKASITSAMRHFALSPVLNIATDILAPYLSQYGSTPSLPGQRIFVRAQILNNVTGILSATLQASALWT
jgi:hypothetical protein